MLVMLWLISGYIKLYYFDALENFPCTGICFMQKLLQTPVDVLSVSVSYDQLGPQVEDFGS